MKTQVDATAPPTAVAAKKSVELVELEKIVAKYNVSDADKKALLAWRHSHDY